MKALPWPARIYLAALVVTSVALTVALAMLEEPLSPSRGLAAAGSAGLIALAWFRPFPLSFKRKLYLDTSILVFVIILFDPAIAMLIAASGTMAANVVRTHDWVEGAFNSAQIALQAATGSLILTASGFNRSLDEMNQPLTVALIVVASIAMYLVNDLLVAGMIAAQSCTPITPVWRRSIVDADRTEHFAYFAQVGLGAAGVVFVLAVPWMILLLIFPVVAIYSTMARNAQLRWRAEMTLRDRNADLAESQRIAHLGSWLWDLKSGSHSWSEETYKLLGVDRDATTPTFEMLISSVHPDDRSLVDGAIHAALYNGSTFSIEHRVCLPSGESRQVHHRGEVILDEEKTKVRLAGTIQDITERKSLEARIENYAERDRIAAELAEGRRRLATSRELERLRLARELHDGPVQDLLAISYHLAAQRRPRGNDRGAVATTDVIEEIRQDILEVVAQLRGLAGELRPPGLAEFGLKPALEGYVSELCRRTGSELPAIAIDVGEIPYLPEQVAMTAFRIVQEALRNAIRHANATNVWIRVSQQPGELNVEIADDGEGFSLPKRMNELADRGHFGLIGLVERVDQAQGTINISSASGMGTKINVTLPVSDSTREQYVDRDSSRARR